MTKNVQPEKQVEHALLYARVSTQMQVNDGMSMEAQEKTLRNAAEFAGFSSVEVLLEEGRSGKSITGRPVLRDALTRLDNGTAQALIVTRIDRLARSTTDFLSIVDRAAKNNWRLVLLDLNLDTSTYQGIHVNNDKFSSICTPQSIHGLCVLLVLRRGLNRKSHPRDPGH